MSVRDGPPGAVAESLAPGPVLFARYAYPPNALGYCGPSDSASLLEAAADRSGSVDLGGLRSLASRFEGAWPYLQLIAGCNGISDPLDARVVQAYWVGNDLLRQVPSSSLVSSLDERFARRAGRNFAPMAAAAPLGGVPQHNFHVFAVYPWLGLLRAGMEGPPLTVLDRCRIRWGHVEEVTGDLVTVRSHLLSFDGLRLTLDADPAVEQVRRSIDGVGFAPGLARGDVVSIHWDWVCDRLSPDDLHYLRRCTRRNLAAVNAMPRPGPALTSGE